MSALAPIEGPSVWHGSRIDLREEGVRTLAAAEVDELGAALRHLRSLGDIDSRAVLGAVNRHLGRQPARRA